MTYPTLEQVNAADRRQVCTWYRSLASPGWWAVGKEDFREVLEREAKVMDRICERLKELGGFTPEISKSIGWDK